jgi:hypothetical protein
MRRKKKREEEGERKKFGVVMMIIIKTGEPSWHSAVQHSEPSGQPKVGGVLYSCLPNQQRFVPHREITAIMTGGVRAKHGVALRSTCLRCT